MEEQKVAVGEYVLELPVGTYTLIVSKKGYVAQEVAVDVVEGETSILDFHMVEGAEPNSGLIVLTASFLGLLGALLKSYKR